MRFDVRLPSSGQASWATSLYTSNVTIQTIQMLCTLLTFSRVIKIKRWMKNTFLYTDMMLMSELHCVQPEAAVTYNPWLRCCSSFELDNKIVLSDCLSLHLSHCTFASLWLSSYIVSLPFHLCTVCMHNAVWWHCAEKLEILFAIWN